MRQEVDQRVLNGQAIEIVADFQDGRDCAALIGNGVTFVYPSHPFHAGDDREPYFRRHFSYCIPTAYVEISRLRRIISRLRRIV